VTIAAADYVIHRREPSWFAIGPLDHAAHLATALLLLPPGWPRPRQASFMAGSLLPDVDHVPLAFQDPEAGDPRPRTHSLIALGPALLGSRSTAAGMAAHYVRDLALEPGVPFLGGRHLKAPYAAYALLVAAAAYWRTCDSPPSRS
jgi:hypothetical protein